MRILTICFLLELVACVESPSDSFEASPAGVDTGGCPVGQQPVFAGRGNELVCDDIPSWPPARTGSRDVAEPGCELADGTYRDLTWTTDHASKLRPAFTYLKELTIDGDHLVVVDKGYTSSSAPPILTVYQYNLDWLNASSANVWIAGDHDTWEFVVWRDCVDGKLHGIWTLNLPYPNVDGPQIESWRFTGAR